MGRNDARFSGCFMDIFEMENLDNDIEQLLSTLETL